MSSERKVINLSKKIFEKNKGKFMKRFIFLLPLCLMCFSPLQSLSAKDSSFCEIYEGVKVKKKYLSQKDFIISHKGIFVLIDGLPRQASRLESDSNGVFVIVADSSEEWTCPKCGTATNSGEVCDKCQWPLHDNDDWTVLF